MTRYHPPGPGALGCVALLALCAAGARAQCVAPQPGMTAWLTLDRNATDLLGRNHGTLLGTPSFATGHVLGAVTFDSDDDAVSIPHDPSLDVGPSGFTAEFWMRGSQNQPQSLYLVVDKSHGHVDSTGWLFQGSSGSGVLEFGIGAGGASVFNFPVVASSGNVLDAVYHHIAGTWDGAQLELWVDGVSQGTTPLAVPVHNDRAVNLGFSWGGGRATRFFRGEVDELSIHPRALTRIEIAAIAGAGRAGKCRPPAGCTFRNGSGVNPSGYACSTAPALGTRWVTTIATTPRTASTVQAFAVLPAVLPALGGELLFTPVGPVAVVVGAGTHTVPIPVDLTLVGAFLVTQGARVETPPVGSPFLQLLNAQDIVVGF